MKIILNSEELTAALLKYYPELSGHTLTSATIKSNSYEPVEILLEMIPINNLKDNT